MFMESGNFLSIRKAEVTEISTAWYIYIAFYYDYGKRTVHYSKGTIWQDGWDSGISRLLKFWCLYEMRSTQTRS